jgi:flavorubredoxin
LDEYELYYVPTEDELEKCYNMGKRLAVRIKEME